LFLSVFHFQQIYLLNAQRTTDIENGKDYPLISRFDNAVIEFYKETKWGSYKLPVN